MSFTYSRYSSGTGIDNENKFAYTREREREEERERGRTRAREGVGFRKKSARGARQVSICAVAQVPSYTIVDWRYVDILDDEFMKLTFKCLSADDIRAHED